MELLTAINNRLAAGVPVGLRKKLTAPDEVEKIPRPSWLRMIEAGVEVLTPREVMSRFRRG